MKILVSWSSGKDSAWMLHVIRAERMGTAAALLTTINESADRVAMHAVRTEILRRQAAAAGLPLITVPIPSPCPNEIYEERMSAACRQAVADGFTHVAFGDLFLEDVRRYREERLAGSGLTPLFPLWGRPTPALAREMIAGGLEAQADLRRSAGPAGCRSRDALSTRHFWTSCRRAPIPAVNAANFTPA